jgi:hypothetical protein
MDIIYCLGFPFLALPPFPPVSHMGVREGKSFEDQ